MIHMKWEERLWMLELGNAHYITFAFTREDAKRKAQSWFGGNPDHYTVTPLTDSGDRIHVALTLRT
jgi:hypothetical protein